MPTILLVDDDIQLLSSLAAALEQAGYRVMRASRLDQAGRIVATDMLDLVLLEVGTEHGRGWDLLREIVAVRRIPVIVVSSYGVEEDVVAALDMGAVDFLAKPFRTNELLARIRVQIRDAGAPQPAITPPVAPPSAAPPAPDVYRSAYAAYDDVDVSSPVFMDAAAEHSLLQERADVEHYEGDIEDLPLGQRFRAARQRRKLSLVQVELDTKIRLWYVQAMEEARFGMLPRSGMAEQMVRTYAAYLGLDIEHALRDFRAEYADLPPQPYAYLGGRPEPRDVPQWAIVTTAVVLALVLGIGGIWFFAADEVSAIGGNLRAIVIRPTATRTPQPTRPPTLTPTRTAQPTVTQTPQPTATSTPQPTNTVQPALTPAATATAGP